MLLLPHHSVLDIKKKLRAFLSGRWTAKYEVIQVGDDNQPSLQGDGKQMKSVGDLDTASEGSVSDAQSLGKEIVSYKVDNNIAKESVGGENLSEEEVVPYEVDEDTIGESADDKQTNVEDIFKIYEEIDGQTIEERQGTSFNGLEKVTEQTFEEHMIPIKDKEKEQTLIDTVTAANDFGKLIFKIEAESKEPTSQYIPGNPDKTTVENSNSLVKSEEFYFDKENGTWNCRLCGNKQKYKQHLQNHVKYCHSSDEVHFPCPCGKTFNWPAALRRHVNAKHETSSFEYQTVCKHACLCGIRYFKMWSLKQHVNKDHGKESKEFKHFESNVETTQGSNYNTCRTIFS